MILHIGDNNYIYKEDVIAIIDKSTVDRENKNNFIDQAIVERKIYGSLEDYIKSYIIAKRDSEIIYYTSRISSKTLSERYNR